ncbi:MAG: hypothetical protein KVP17_000227 [Porospora cf. gigantea B]|nr:MAG: hypothetical protein KVP17_000227 [Porospora cf. gigantea B]
MVPHIHIDWDQLEPLLSTGLETLSIGAVGALVLGEGSGSIRRSIVNYLTSCLTIEAEQDARHCHVVLKDMVAAQPLSARVLQSTLISLMGRLEDRAMPRAYVKQELMHKSFPMKGVYLCLLRRLWKAEPDLLHAANIALRDRRCHPCALMACKRHGLDIRPSKP